MIFLKVIKNTSISFLISFIILSIATLIYTILLSTNAIESSNDAIYKTSFIIGVISFLILGFTTGLLEKNKTLIKAVFVSLFFILIIIVIKLIIKDSLTFPIFLKYIIYLLSSSLGGILSGILSSKRKK